MFFQRVQVSCKVQVTGLPAVAVGGVFLCSWGDDTHDTYDTSYGLPHTTHDACDARDDATSAHDAGTHATYQCPGSRGFSVAVGSSSQA